MRETITCPHCGESLQPLGVGMHMASCIRKPGVLALVRELMDPDNTGYGCTVDAYRRISVAYNDAAPADAVRAPSSDTLARKCGSWGAVLELLGLKSRQRARQPRRDARAIEQAAIAEVAEAITRQHAERLIERGLPVCDFHYDATGQRVHGPRPLPDGRVARILR